MNLMNLDSRMQASVPLRRSADGGIRNDRCRMQRIFRTPEERPSQLCGKREYIGHREVTPRYTELGYWRADEISLTRRNPCDPLRAPKRLIFFSIVHIYGAHFGSIVVQISISEPRSIVVERCCSTLSTKNRNRRKFVVDYSRVEGDGRTYGRTRDETNFSVGRAR